MKLLHSKAGVTVLEGVIALGLLAVVTAGAFGVLLSASRKSSQPDVREEMTLAVEQAKNLLQMYVGDGKDHVSAEYAQGLCTGQSISGTNLNDSDPLALEHTHNIICMLPSICDQSHEDSAFTYIVKERTPILNTSHHLPEGDIESKIYSEVGGPARPYKIQFSISCNGYEL